MSKGTTYGWPLPITTSRSRSRAWRQGSASRTDAVWTRRAVVCKRKRACLWGAYHLDLWHRCVCHTVWHSWNFLSLNSDSLRFLAANLCILIQWHFLECVTAKQSSTRDSGEIPKLKSRDSTKELGQAIKQIGTAPKYYGLLNGGANTSGVTGMPMGTKTYREMHVNLRPKEAFTDSMLGMTRTISALVQDTLADASVSA